MNDNTKVKYNIARMYEYVTDICDIVSRYDYRYDTMLDDKLVKHAINGCIVQLGEHAARIRDIDKTTYLDAGLQLYKIKGLRDRIVHSYGDINYTIIKDILKNDIPILKKYIEEYLCKEVLENPYILYEKEYSELLKDEKENEYDIEI